MPFRGSTNPGLRQLSQVHSKFLHRPTSIFLNPIHLNRDPYSSNISIHALFSTCLSLFSRFIDFTFILPILAVLHNLGSSIEIRHARALDRAGGPSLFDSLLRMIAIFVNQRHGLPIWFKYSHFSSIRAIPLPMFKIQFIHT